jgi:hypothetical protein
LGLTQFNALISIRDSDHIDAWFYPSCDVKVVPPPYRAGGDIQPRTDKSCSGPKVSETEVRKDCPEHYAHAWSVWGCSALDMARGCSGVS